MKVMLMRYLAIGAGGFFGAIGRYIVSQLIGHFNVRFPLGTLVINVTGSLFLGWFMTYVGPRNMSDAIKLAIGVGFVGAYTTFSTFMYESSKLADDGAGLAAMTNLIGSIVLGLLAVRLGMYLAQRA